MSNIIKVVKEEATRLENALKKIDKFLDKAPEGCLKWQNKKGKVYYVHQIERVKTEINTEVFEDANKDISEKHKVESKWIRKYIKKQDMSLAKVLAQKHYYMSIRPILEHNLNELNRLLKRYKQNDVEEIYDSLREERKSLVIPVSMSVKEKIREWKEEVYEKNMMYSENLRYETEQGDFVRSKSEVIIANLLYQNCNHILYKYERALEVMEHGRMKTIYPDFTILNVHTGKVMYWEHAGRMDDPYYAADFVKKMNTYIANDLLPGRDVVLTFETQGNAIDIGGVKKVLNILI